MRIAPILLPVLAFAASTRVEVHPKAPFGIDGIAEDPAGALLLAGGNGIYRYDGYRYTAVRGYPFPHANRIAAAGGGAFWVGAREAGVVYFQPPRTFKTCSSVRAGAMLTFGRFVFVWDRVHLRMLRFDQNCASISIDTPPDCYPIATHRLWLSCVSGEFEVDPERMSIRQLSRVRFPIPDA